MQLTGIISLSMKLIHEATTSRPEGRNWVSLRNLRTDLLIENLGRKYVRHADNRATDHFVRKIRFIRSQLEESKANILSQMHLFRTGFNVRDSKYNLRGSKW